MHDTTISNWRNQGYKQEQVSRLDYRCADHSPTHPENHTEGDALLWDLPPCPLERGRCTSEPANVTPPPGECSLWTATPADWAGSPGPGSWWSAGSRFGSESLSLLPGLHGPKQELLDRWDCQLLFLGGKQGRLATQRGLPQKVTAP